MSKEVKPHGKQEKQVDEHHLKTWGKSQGIILEIKVDAKQVEMEAEFVPALPGMNPHKVNYGVLGNQADAANLLAVIRKALFEKGYNVIRPDGVEEYGESKNEK